MIFDGDEGPEVRFFSLSGLRTGCGLSPAEDEEQKVKLGNFRRGQPFGIVRIPGDPYRLG